MKLNTSLLFYIISKLIIFIWTDYPGEIVRCVPEEYPLDMPLAALYNQKMGNGDSVIPIWKVDLRFLNI